MSLSLHLAIHLFLSLLAGLIIWKLWKKPIVSFVGGIVGGFFIDFDHVIDYFLVFGPSFSPDYFFHGYQFLKSGKLYILFHGWEYVIILLIVALVMRRNLAVKSAFLSIALGMLFHLIFDVSVNDGMRLKSYSIFYRRIHNFQIEKVVTSDHYQKNLTEKENNKFLYEE